jgi:hypothetical protein
VTHFLSCFCIYARISAKSGKKRQYASCVTEARAQARAGASLARKAPLRQSARRRLRFAGCASSETRRGWPDLVVRAICLGAQVAAGEALRLDPIAAPAGHPSATRLAPEIAAAVGANRSSGVNAIGPVTSFKSEKASSCALGRNRIQKVSPERPHREPNSVKLQTGPLR